MYEIKKGRPYYYPLVTLIFSYTVPRSFEDSYLKNFLVKFAAVTLFRFVVACFLPMTHFIKHLKANTGIDTAEDLSTSIGEFGCLSTMVTFTLKYKKWSEFFNEVTVIKKFQPSANIEKFARNSNRFSAMYLCYILTGLTMYGILGFNKTSHCKQLNEEKSLHEDCFVYHTSWIPFYTDDIFSTVTIYIVQVIVSGHLLSSAAMILFIVFESTEILIIHMNILKEGFINLFEETPNDEISAKLRFCINYHNHILRLAKRFNNMQKFTIGQMSFISALVFGCILHQIQNTKSFGAILHLIGYITAIAFVCHAGQRITDESSSIADAVYASNWIKANRETMKDLAFIIQRSQAPLYLNCIPLGIYDYALFIAILKTSYSYVTLLDGTT